MKTRGSWGIVYVAAIFALITIGVALATYSFEKKAGTTDALTTENDFLNWQNVSSTVSGDTGQGPSLSDAISQDLLEGYSTLVAKGGFTTAERDQMLAALVKKNVQVPAIVPGITLAELNIASTSAEKYTALLGTILKQASSVKRYELNVFVDAIQAQTKTGIPELKDDAALYQKIAAEALLMPVPAELATKHLEAVKSIGALANIVGKMGGWSGDPIEAMVYLDSFNKAEAYVTNSLNTVFTAALAFGKKT